MVCYGVVEHWMNSFFFYKIKMVYNSRDNADMSNEKELAKGYNMILIKPLIGLINCLININGYCNHPTRLKLMVVWYIIGNRIL